jgi:hypothetical protein
MKRWLPLFARLVRPACDRQKPHSPKESALPRRAVVGPKFISRVLESLATPGALVAAGDLLARLEVQEIRAKVELGWHLQSLSENSEGSCFQGNGPMAIRLRIPASAGCRRGEGAYPQRSVTDEQRSQRAVSAKTLRAAGLLPVAGVGSAVTAHCGDAPQAHHRRTLNPLAPLGARSRGTGERAWAGCDGQARQLPGTGPVGGPAPAAGRIREASTR